MMRRKVVTHQLYKYLVFLLIFLFSQGCAINFELTSQRTALEKQILGSYEELDDDLLMISSVRALDEEGKKKGYDLSDLQMKALKAKQNQQFNRDDIDELKNDQILGENSRGYLSVLPKGVGLINTTTKKRLNLAKLLTKEENHDREIVWARIIQLNENLSKKDIPKIRETFAKQAYQDAPAGHWFQGKSGIWKQKK